MTGGGGQSTIMCSAYAARGFVTFLDVEGPVNCALGSFSCRACEILRKEEKESQRFSSQILPQRGAESS